MNITIKNLKVAEFASDETLCFSCSVYADGVKQGTAKNQGHGGPNFYEFDTRSLEAYAAPLPPVKYEGGEYPTDLDVIVDALIQEELKRREIKGWCRNLIVFRHLGQPEGEYHTIGTRFTPALRDQILAKYPGATIYNELV